MKASQPEFALTSSRSSDLGHRVGQESWAWVFMRLSGVALAFLVLGHLFVIRVLVGLNQVSLGFVAVQWSGLGWRLYDLVMLVLAMVHGANGLRGLAYDHLPIRARARVLGAAYLLCGAALGLGTYVIVVFHRPL
jgi:succinate dehydrogenase / fumarate reductase membrane anchor subunit